MQPVRIERAHRLTRWGTAIGLAVAVVGVLVLLAYAASEVLADPSLSLEDGYWIGRLPWTPIGVGMTILGATIAVVAGTLAALLAGGIVRRTVAILSLGVGVFWWFAVTVPLLGLSGAWCGQRTCPAPSIDPVSMANSSPELTAMWLLVPALVVSALALTSSPRTR